MMFEPLPAIARRRFRRLWTGRCLVLLLALAAARATAQEPAEAAPPDLRTELAGHFDASAGKLVALARAMPAESYAWQPAEGVYTVARVYAHIARYNYLYPDQNLDLEVPVAYRDFESQLREKEEVVEALERSLEYVRGVMQGMSDEALNSGTRLYGRDVASWAVLLQLVAHMNEHLGQAIAYARMNEVVPPWSR